MKRYSASLGIRETQIKITMDGEQIVQYNDVVQNCTLENLYNFIKVISTNLMNKRRKINNKK